MKERIAITGSEGTIGSVLKKGLSEQYEITPLDLPNIDVRDYKRLIQIFPGHAVVIHLAWDTKTDNYRSERINPENALMFSNVYSACVKTGVSRVIMASSVHADGFYRLPDGKLLNPHDFPNPDSPYGAHKVFMEVLGKWYASEKSLEVVCIRFGGVNPQNKPPKVNDSNSVEERAERTVWLSHRDCVELVKRCIEAKFIPGNFTIIYGVSDNTERIHDISNPVGWAPKDRNDDFDKKKK